MKTKEELNALKKDVEALQKKLSELTEEELEAVTGGTNSSLFIGGGTMLRVPTFGIPPESNRIKPASCRAWFGTEIADTNPPDLTGDFSGNFAKGSDE